MPQTGTGRNLCGDCGFVRIDPSDLSDIARWEMTLENTVPEFCHSGSGGCNVTLKGKFRGDVSFEQILDADDAVYDAFTVGDLVTLLLYENATRFWTVVARIKTIGETVEINDAREEIVRVTAVIHGPYLTSPNDPHPYNGCGNPYGDPSLDDNIG
jgi:hypothetical protein